MNLTKNDTLKFHKIMWTDMQKQLGDNPSYKEREDFKKKWIDHNFPGEHIRHNCFLCEFIKQNPCNMSRCINCPIDWSSLAKPGSAIIYTCCTEYNGEIKNGQDSEIYLAAPISEILNLPVKGEK